MPAPREAAPATTPYTPIHKLRVVTAASLFDGHDAAINVMRRILQSSGAEVVHLGHNRSVAEIAQAAIQEDAQAVAVSSYQGGHNEYFRYLKDLLSERGASISVFSAGVAVSLFPRRSGLSRPMESRVSTIRNTGAGWDSRA